MKTNRKPMLRVLDLLLIGLLLVFAVTTCSLLTGSRTFASFRTGDSGGDSARVAAFSFGMSDGTNSHIVALNEIRKPSDSQSYTFTVSGDSEVAVNCRLQLTLNGSMPLTATLMQGETLLDTMDLRTGHAPDSALEKDNSATFAPNVTIGQTYTLTLTWPEGEKNVKYASGSGVGSLTLTVLGEQVD